MTARRRLRRNQRLGKYRIVRHIAEGGFAEVYEARDTIEQLPVALKIPLISGESDPLFAAYLREIRITAKLDHPHILPIKSADLIDGRLVIATPLGDESLDDRLGRRLSTRMARSFIDQMLVALAFAHGKNVIHCDVKPENFILYGRDELRLGDFGLARERFFRTRQGSGSGTLGYVAPEQALGKPSMRSDVFSLGLIIYRMLSGKLPEWPYDWPPPGIDRLRRRAPELEPWLERALQIDARRRFRDVQQMAQHLPRPRRGSKKKANRRRAKDWRLVRFRSFQQRYKKVLETDTDCERCSGPVSEAMVACPWCGHERTRHRDTTKFPRHCPRCNRGVKSDWRFCAWCHGAAIGPSASGQYTDVRYRPGSRCSNGKCPRKELMPWMRYCPWCSRKVRQVWRVPELPNRCSHCGWSITKDEWRICPWCTKSIAAK
ncbi:MAG: serine/threonine-protein kinase [Planctomycetota bacterium]